MASGPSPDQLLDLTALESHSPNWPSSLRFAVCLATAYSVRACYHRVEAYALALDDAQAIALPKPGEARSHYNPHAHDDEATLGAKTEHFEEEGEDSRDASPHQRVIMERVRHRRRHEFLQDWDEFSHKFLQATCQHLGVAVHTLPPADDMSEEEVLRYVRGSTGEAVELEKSPVESESNEEEEGRPAVTEGEIALASSPPTEKMEDLSLDDDGDSLKEALPEPMDKPDDVFKLPKGRPGSYAMPKPPVGSDAKSSFVEPGQEVEIVHELMLVALGLGQFRASDGATTIFEQDQIFEDEANVRDISASQPATSVPHHIRGQSVEEDTQVTDELASLEQTADGVTPSEQPNPIDESPKESEAPQPTINTETETSTDEATREGKETSQQPGSPELPPRLPPRKDAPAESGKPTPSDEGNFLSAPPLPPRHTSPVATPFDKPAPPPLPPRLPPRRPASQDEQHEEKPSIAPSWVAPKKLLGSIKWGLTGGKSESNTESSVPPTPSVAAEPEGPVDDSQPKPKEAVKPNEIFHYDARSRAVIFQTLRAMGLESVNVYQGEKVLAQSIYFLVQEGQRKAKENGNGDILADGHAGRGAWMNKASAKVLAKERTKSNWGKWAAAGVGFTIAGVLTGGLAAPLLAPVLVGMGAGYLATTGGVVLMGTLLGLGGGGLAGYRVERRLRGLDRFVFSVVETPASEAGVTIPSLHATICVSGLLTEPSQQTEPWKAALAYTIPDPRDIYAVEFETDLMVEAGTGLQRYVSSQLIRTGGTHAATEVVKTTALAGLTALTLPLTVMSVASAALDSTFMRAKTKAHKAGLVLAETLRNEVQGHRPVVLIGVSLGVTTVLSALVELAAKNPESDAQLIDSVYLIGGPTVPSTRTIKKARSVVARRFVNAWSSKDMVCGVAAFLGSGMDIQDLRDGKLPRVMGSGPVDLGIERDELGRLVQPVENVDVSEVISSHAQLNDEGHLAAVLARCHAFVG